MGKTGFRLIFISAVLVSLLCACGQSTETPPADASPQRQRLVFSVVEMETPGYTVEELEGVTEKKLIYSGLLEVNVTLEGEEVPLAQALREKALTVPEIFAFARIDAGNGYCTETYYSENGLTYFTYTYPQCELNLKYDVYETPDGAQHLIEDISVHDIPGPNTIVSLSKSKYVDEKSQWGYFLDREDWGLDFALKEATSSQMTLNCTQHGGQQFGLLSIEGYYLYATATEGMPAYIGKAFAASAEPAVSDPSGEFPVSIPMDSSGQITIDWSEDLGNLNPGSYYIQLIVADIYEETEVHPLTRNFYDKQSYHIPFTVS